MTNKFVILTRDNCPYCEKAEALLKRFREDYQKFNVIENPVLRDFLKAQGLNTVPQIYLNGTRIGGFTELAERYSAQLELFDK